MRQLTLSAFLFVLLLPWTGGCERHPHNSGGDHDQGHAHGQGGAAHAHEEEELEPGSVTLFTPELELFMEYRPLVVGKEVRFAAHLTVLATGEPVRSGRLELQYMAADGSKGVAAVDAPARDGLFNPIVKMTQPGKYQAALVLQSPQANGRIEVGELVVYPDMAAARKAVEVEAGPAAQDVVPFLMEQQWKIQMLLAEAQPRTLSRRLSVPGRIELPTNAAAVVSTPAAGRLIRIEGGAMPKLGQIVTAGQPLAALELMLPTTEATQLLANRAAIQASQTELALREMELQSKAAEIEGAIAQSQARLKFAKRNHDRIAPLGQKGIASQEQLDRAQADLQIAEAEHHAAIRSRQSYEQAINRLESLRKQIGAQPVESAAGLAMPLVCPIAGQIVEIPHAEGERVEAGAAIYRIIDASTVWVTAAVGEFDFGSVQQAGSAVVTIPAYPGKMINLDPKQAAAPAGAIVDAQSRTLPIRYSLDNSDGQLKPGMFANVAIEIGRAENVVAIPEEAVVMDNGRPLAFVLLEGESFQKREVELGIRDGGFVQVIRGVKSGERVATKGAYAIKVTASAPSSFSHGHAH